MSEFEMIAEYFAPLTLGRKEAGGLKDDAAVLAVPEGRELVVTSDTLNEGVHFLKGEKPQNIARKALRVNLSDLAAMGADPYCYQLCASFPEKPDPAWLRAFSDALLADQETFGIFCSGGDTTSLKGEHMSLTITALGLSPEGKALRRKGAKPGDAIVLTGPVGDAALGLHALKRKNTGDDFSLYAEAIQRYQAPWPRTEIAGIIRKHATAATDISDGLLADIGHICAASHVGARIELFGMAYSEEVRRAMEDAVLTLEQVLTSGDDYELALAVPAERAADLLRELGEKDLNPFVIGVFQEKEAGFRVFDASGNEMWVKSGGWQHF